MSVYVCLLPKTSAAFSLNITLATQRNSGEQNLLQDCCILDYQLQLHVVFGCLATGVVMVEYITPPDLALMDSSQLGSSWAHIGWGSWLAWGWSGPTGVRVQTFFFGLARPPGFTLVLTIICTYDNPWQSSLSVAIQRVGLEKWITVGSDKCWCSCFFQANCANFRN